MRRIDELCGKKAGKTALVVAGGLSAGVLDYESIDRSKLDIIALNDSLYYEDGYRVKPDYLIYSDVSFVRVLIKMVTAGVDVIGDVNAPSPKVKYSFVKNQFSFKFKDTHNVALKSIFILQSMGYDEIYFTGLDLKADDVDGKIVSHHQGDKVGKGEKYPDESALLRHIKRLEAFIDQFNEVESFEGVYNTNSESRLKKIPFKTLPKKLQK